MEHHGTGETLHLGLCCLAKASAYDMKLFHWFHLRRS
jgi:hypothetical protein